MQSTVQTENLTASCVLKGGGPDPDIFHISNQLEKLEAARGAYWTLLGLTLKTLFRQF